ncbi:MAG TPA: signal recognition particle-docking protein FtsY [Erysipelothrix sp.]|nr:signal recognition particle-docking protein FtsY [Erysipelothrix sp.]
MSFFKKISEAFKQRSDKQVYSEGLDRKKSTFINKLLLLFEEENEIDQEWIERMMIVLIEADVSVSTARKLMKNFNTQLQENQIVEKMYAKDVFLQVLNDFYGEDAQPLQLAEDLTVILMVGVNGSGKTTSSAKLASMYKNQGKKVGFIAADTFRAAATEQLGLWAQKLEVAFYKGDLNADPSSVIVDGLKQAQRDELDIVIIDTAGRLQTKVNLMNELSKMKRVMTKFVPGAPHATYLVLDGNLGQNSLTQAREFEKATHVDGIILTKMDGTAKGGIIFTIIDEMNLKVNYIGLGEQMDDMRPFYRDQFFESMLQVESNA